MRRQLTHKIKSGREVFAGGWNAAIETVDPRTMRYVSSNILRILYLQELGLTWDQPVARKPRYLYQWEEEYPITVEYHVTVTKLETPSFGDIVNDKNDLELIESQSRTKFELTKNHYKNFIKEYPYAFPISKTAIEWGFRHFKYVILDNQHDNYLKCPITGKVYPYDVLNVDYMMHRGYLKLPIDRYVKIG